MNAAILYWFQSMRTDWLNQIVLTFTFSIWPVCILTCLILLIRPQTRKFGILVTAGLLASLAAANGLKAIVREIRPYAALPGLTRVGPVPGGSSFPSAHSASAFSLAFAWLITKRKGRWLVLTYAILIALSRLYLGVHYPSDVLAGAALAALCCWAVYCFWKKKERKPTC